eukprot:TRINITY_DN7344_c0_g1_i1.p1 TRINITY_DN7344_c0_g1~~TRINITY_DN7344_c0_g1_i1.p1  ORF type:complete len:480 (+),score=99.98 TRINITY_DN7344_c0_g1_i1:214-1653(+)
MAAPSLISNEALPSSLPSDRPSSAGKRLPGAPATYYTEQEHPSSEEEDLMVDIEHDADASGPPNIASRDSAPSVTPPSSKKIAAGANVNPSTTTPSTKNGDGPSIRFVFNRKLLAEAANTSPQQTSPVVQSQPASQAEHNPPQPSHPRSRARKPAAPVTPSHATPQNSDLLQENRSLRKEVDELRRARIDMQNQSKIQCAKIEKQKVVLSRYRRSLISLLEGKVPDLETRHLDEIHAIEDDPELAKYIEPPTLTNGTSSHTSPIQPSLITSTITKPMHHLPSFAPSPSSPTHPLSSSEIHSTMSNTPRRFDDSSEDSGSDSEGDMLTRRSDGFHDGDKGSGKKKLRRNALWTESDDEEFTRLYTQHGKSWKTIHSFMPSKTREQIQSHGQYLIRVGKLVDVELGSRKRRKKNDGEQELHVAHPHPDHVRTSPATHHTTTTTTTSTEPHDRAPRAASPATTTYPWGHPATNNTQEEYCYQ